MAIRQFEFNKDAKQDNYHQYLLRVPNALWDKVVERCNSEYSTVNAFIIRALVKATKED